MKIVYLFLILLISCKNSPPPSGICKELEDDVKNDWHVIAGSSYPNVSDTLLYKLQNNYKDCMIGKDSTYIIKLFGRKYNLGLPGGRMICSDITKLKYSLEYPMKTPRYPFQESDGYEMQLLIDSNAIVRCVYFHLVNARGIQ